MRHLRIIFLVAVAIVLLTFSVSLLSAQEIEKININTATVVELMQLKRVGPKIAQRIVEYREKHGPFEKSEDIIKVKGIGRKVFELNKDRITVE